MSQKRERKTREFPHTFVILFCIIAVMTICTYIIPAGNYARVYNENADREVVDANSFEYAASTPVSFFDFLNAIPEGMVEVADIIGLSRQTAVLAFQFGDGFTNAIIPTHGTLCASLGMAGIPFNKWFKFALPVVAVELVICAMFMVIATVTNYGPF